MGEVGGVGDAEEDFDSAVGVPVVSGATLAAVPSLVADFLVTADEVVDFVESGA